MATILINDAPRGGTPEATPQYAGVSVEQPEAEEQSIGPAKFLNIDESRLASIVQDICTRIEECRTDMGLSFGVALARANSWAWDRQIARMSYQNDFNWRLPYGETFRMNNWSQNVPRRFIRLMAAKIADDLLGTEPFFAAMPDKAKGASLVKQVEAKTQEEISRSNLRKTLIEAIRVALTEGERAIKVTHLVDSTSFVGPAVVAVDAAGNPFKTPDGSYIFPKDDFIQTITLPDGSVKVLADAEAAQAESQGLYVEQRLKKEPSFVIQPGSPCVDPATGTIRYRRVDDLVQEIVHKDGLDASSPFAEDFIFPITVPHLSQADIMVHCYDEAVLTMEMLYGNANLGNEIARNRGKLMATGAMSAQGQPNLQQGETTILSAGSAGHVREIINVHECYYRCKVNPDDERESWLFVVLDYASRTPIYAEYLGNLKMKRPPFVLIRGVESVPGRAYGMGVYKMMEHSNLFIDLCFNRIALKSSKEVSVTFQHRDGTEETRNGLEMQLGGKKVYSIPANSEFGKDRPPIFRVNLAEMDDFSIAQMEQMVAAEQLSFGIVSMAELDASNAPIAKNGTATATRNIERSGNLLQRATENMIAGDIEEVLELAVDSVLENMDEDDVQYVEGEEMLATLNRDEIRDLSRDVRLLLTKARSEESIMINTAAKNAILEYYQLPPSMRKRVRNQYIAILKSYDVQDADDILEEVTDEMLSAEQQGATGDKPPSERINLSMKLADLAPSEQAQALKILNIEPDPNRGQMLQPQLQPEPQPAQ